MNKVRIVIQCRLNSSRLPAKALLPVANMSSVALAALRAGNTGIDTWVAISDQESDELLLQELRNYNIKVKRGPLNDVLKRFVLLTGDMLDNDIVVRLTADNLFPDGSFVEELTAKLIDGGLKYLGTASPLDGLPYGMSAEAFRVGVLREADKGADSPYDREHVTPWIKSRYGNDIFRPVKTFGNLSHLRCTLDTFEDYLLIKRLFQGVDDPIGIIWFQLCKRLAGIPNTPEFRVPYTGINNEIHSRLTLGSAQLGMNYGAANQTGLPDIEEVKSILDTAIAHGVNSFDTARAYGDSEKRLGLCLEPYKDRIRIITKLSPLSELAEKMLRSSIYNAIDASIFRSCRELKLHTLPVVLLHNPEHLHLHDGLIWKRIEYLRDEGIIGRLGVSVYNPQQMKYALKNYKIDHIQIPFNLLDWRWREAEAEQTACAHPDTIVCARSIYLQGILPASINRWPKFAQKDAVYWTSNLQQLANELGRNSIQELCLAYVLGQDWIHSAVIGVETLLQLKNNLELFLTAPLTGEESKYAESKLSGASERLLNPSLW